MKDINIKNISDRFKDIGGIFNHTRKMFTAVDIKLKTFDKLFNLMIVINVLLIICVALLTYEVSNLKG